MPIKGYLAPLIVQPLHEKHTHTIIALHGRGSNAGRFGPTLLEAADLQVRLPTVKFVFPTASKRRSTVLKRIPINQWFDNYSLVDPGERTELQIEGLQETSEIIRGLIDEEAALLGDKAYGKIILLGLSQGCAAGGFTLLGGFSDTKREAIGAFVGMSGWLPFENELQQIIQIDQLPSSPQHANSIAPPQTNLDSSDDSEDLINANDESSAESYSGEEDLVSVGELETESENEDPFGQSLDVNDDFNPFEEDEEEERPPLIIQTIDHIRGILDLPLLEPAWRLSTDSKSSFMIPQLRTPVFMGHGTEDPKVSVLLGRKMSNFLSTGLGMNVTWKSYDGLGHWYRVEDELEDIIDFLRRHVGLTAFPRPSLGHNEDFSEN
ncbi:Acyl-protein thioesterase 1 [Penicillium brevicompactum]|uniref:Phospholipase/carboxylesterase/thioesterase n=1 Tax=Penicillium brevicompactum TaxID=5074 RepID=UPI0025425EAA|nr:Phospholipase/carboxylesterase/thioesterase [Penicillium brevicompactum]KAJ5325270.1 Phospholipase/carboxylesterase/thioesterase [Penicillium brevicompactum]